MTRFGLVNCTLNRRVILGLSVLGNAGNRRIPLGVEGKVAIERDLCPVRVRCTGSIRLCVPFLELVAVVREVILYKGCSYGRILVRIGDCLHVHSARATVGEVGNLPALLNTIRAVGVVLRNVPLCIILESRFLAVRSPLDNQVASVIVLYLTVKGTTLNGKSSLWPIGANEGALYGTGITAACISSISAALYSSG